MEPRGYRLRSAIWKLVLVAATLAAIFFSYGSLKGIAPGVSVTQAVLEPIRNVAALSKPLTHAVGSAVKCIPCR